MSQKRYRYNNWHICLCLFACLGFPQVCVAPQYPLDPIGPHLSSLSGAKSCTPTAGVPPPPHPTPARKVNVDVLIGRSSLQKQYLDNNYKTPADGIIFSLCCLCSFTSELVPLQSAHYKARIHRQRSTTLEKQKPFAGCSACNH